MTESFLQVIILTGVFIALNFMMNIRGILRLLVVLCCVATCHTMDSEFKLFAKDPVKFF